MQVTEPPATTAFVAPPAPEPAPPPAPEPPTPPAPEPAPPVTAPPAPASSAPAPLAAAAAPDVAIAVDGYAHAIFVDGYFSGPVTGYSAVSSDPGVATVAVHPPDMAIITPVSRGSTIITVTASGAGGTATQNLRADVGDGPVQVERPAPSPSPPASPPPPAPEVEESIFEPPPEVEESIFEPPPAQVEELTPLEDEEIPPPAPGTDEATDAAPGEAPAAEVATSPTLSGSMPAQEVGVGRSILVDVSPFFGGVVQRWAVNPSDPTVVVARVSEDGGLTLRGVSAGTTSVTVTAANDMGEVAQLFLVRVWATPTTTTTTAATDSQSGLLVLVGPNPSVTVAAGGFVNLDMRAYFSDAATDFSVDNRNSGVTVTVAGSVASISGVTPGTYTILLIASTSNSHIRRPAKVTVN